MNTIFVNNYERRWSLILK